MTRAHPSRIPEYLEHILGAIDRAESYLAGLSDAAAFEQDWKSQDAVIRNIEIIGEAANRIIRADQSFPDQHSEVEWDQMRAMRNKIIHDYFEIDAAIVWQTVKIDFPPLRLKIRAILRALQSL